LGYGANAIYPYLALDIIRKIVAEDGAEGSDSLGVNLPQAMDNYRQAINAGLLKIMSKMGISTLFSYQGAKIFEAVGLGQEVIDDCFVGTPSPIGGIGYIDIAVGALQRHADAFPMEGLAELWNEGFIVPARKGGEYHSWSKKVVSGMNTFIRKGGDWDAYQNWREASDTHPPTAIKDLLRLSYPKRADSVPLAEVEPIEEIRRRFTTAAMSLGALSPEMHETLAIAMNRIGGKSNSCEGG
jgi:glutamate synthase (NADPH/NADH) large chain/glutamate synthase (ferredoxin)